MVTVQLDGILKYRTLYDVRQVPPEIPAVYTKEFFGCLPRDFGNTLVLQWQEFLNERRSRPQSYWDNIGRDGGAFPSSYKYWQSKEKEWDVLARVARWWCALQLSAILAERLFALGRVINIPSRASMSWETFTMELSLRLQQSKVEQLMLQKAAEL